MIIKAGERCICGSVIEEGHVGVVYWPMDGCYHPKIEEVWCEDYGPEKEETT